MKKIKMNYRCFRTFALFIIMFSNLLFAGAQTLGEGTRTNFDSPDVNTDPIWIARYNSSPNASELRINIGDDYGQAEDKLAIGVYHYADNLWHPVLTIQNNRNIIADGKITATEIVVKQNVWADFVFHPSYQLKPLTEVEEFVKSNGHLQDIPSASEVEQNGVNVGEMHTKLLQKVEEVTLYLIEQSKQIEALKKENELLKQENKINTELLLKEINDLKSKLQQ